MQTLVEHAIQEFLTNHPELLHGSSVRAPPEIDLAHSRKQR